MAQMGTELIRKITFRLNILANIIEIGPSLREFTQEHNYVNPPFKTWTLLRSLSVACQGQGLEKLTFLVDVPMEPITF